MSEEIAKIATIVCAAAAGYVSSGMPSADLAIEWPLKMMNTLCVILTTTTSPNSQSASLRPYTYCQYAAERTG
ncbi:MAG: hypothetical protein ACREA9_29455 [Pyrinomonadaceae bacterium]